MIVPLIKRSRSTQLAADVLALHAVAAVVKLPIDDYIEA